MQHFGTVMLPRSPLPDSTALEAGIMEDERSSRLSRIQDDVRNLLRTSVFGSMASSPTTPIHARPHVTATASSSTPPTLRPIQPDQLLRSHPPSPVPEYRSLRRPAQTRFPVIARPEVLPSPTDSTTSVSTTHCEDVRNFPHPPSSYQRNVKHMAHQSTLFNTRAVAALNHPDLSALSVSDISQQKSKYTRQHGAAWTRHRTSSHGSGSSHGKHKRRAHRAADCTGLLCFLAAVLLAALVAIYVSLAMTVNGVTTTFHVLFILGILLTTIVFSHALIRFFLYSKRRNSGLPTFVRVARQGHQRRHRNYRDHLHPHVRRMPTLAGEHEEPFVPPTPIEVYVRSDEVCTDSIVANPAAAMQTPHDWDKDSPKVANPPPAYGRWRDSVRANPDLLHWVPSPISPGTPVLPSPTYEAIAAGGWDDRQSNPPSYRTRDSPARQRQMQEARARVEDVEVVEPEMFEVRGRVSPGAGAGPRVGEAF